ncbi:hypothetical protein WJX82_001759 [Trebouxia sp. C0006]
MQGLRAKRAQNQRLSGTQVLAVWLLYQFAAVYATDPSITHLLDISSGNCLESGVVGATDTTTGAADVGSNVTISTACNASQYPQLVFEMTHGGSLRHVASGLQPGLCLQASLDGLIALTEGCNTAFLQWAFYPVNGALAAFHHSATNLCLHPAGESSSVSSGTEVYLTSNCSEPLADFALSPDGILRHQYSGLCVAVNPSAPSTTPPPPPPEGAAAVESASIGSPDAPVLLSAGKDSVQSSTSGQLVAALAVDGNTSSAYGSCATTLSQGAQYWQVDLGDTYQIANVTVINRDVNGTGDPPFSVFVGDEDASSTGSYTVLDNTNCTAYPVQFTANSEVLAVPCTKQGRYVVVKATGGPLVLCEVLVYGYTPDSNGAATESAGNDVTDLVLTSSCTTQFTYTGAGQLELVSTGQCVTASDVLADATGSIYRVPQLTTCNSSSTADMFVWSLFTTS